MASTNTTANYGLPQYIATDKPTYLGDFNNAMLSIDTAIKGASDRGIANQSNIAQAQTNIEDHDSRLGTVEAETTVNTSDIATANQNIINLQSQTNTQGQQIATITQATNANTLVIGAGQLETEAQTIIPAINELNSDLTHIVVTEKTYELTLSASTLAAPYSYFGSKDLSSDISQYGNIMNAEAHNSNGIPSLIGIRTGFIAIAAMSVNVTVTVRYLHLPR